MTGIDTWDHNTYYQSGDRALLQSNAAVMSLPGNYANLGAFYQKVRNGGTWDYKNQDRAYYFFGDSLVDKETFGNRHYGYTGSAARFDDTLLEVAAGYAQVRSSNARLQDARTYFDDPNDTTNIRVGISAYTNNNQFRPASFGQIAVQSTINSQTRGSIYRQLVSIKNTFEGLVKKLSR